MTLQEIEEEVAKLPDADLAKFREWFDEFSADRWDRQIEDDFSAGKLDGVIAEARRDIATGRDPAALTHRTTSRFWALFGNLPIQIQERARRNFELLK